MIKYEWRSALDPDETAQLTDLLQRASDYDAEPEYTSIAVDELLHSMSGDDSRFRHLIIWMLPYATIMGEDEHPEQIAGLMRITVGSDGAAQAALVIDPRLRSIGITTLLLERIGLDFSAPEGWSGTGIRELSAWAQGNHPAAGRLSNRFLIPRTRRVWKLIRPAESAGSASAAPVLEEHRTTSRGSSPGWLDDFRGVDTLALRAAGRLVAAATIDLNPVISEEFGPCATVGHYRAAPSATAQDRRGLLAGLSVVAHEAGLRGLIIHVDSDDAAWVNTCRLSGFQHDRTDVRYQLGGSQ